MRKAIISDMDGTLADCSHRQHWVQSKPKNWKAFNAAIINDPPHEDIIELVDILRHEYPLIICSGRSEDEREVTEQWLWNHAVRYKKLYMRASKDYRDDSIVKVELLAQMRDDGYEPFIWLDDRQRVVDAIRAEGIRVLQVQPGDF